VSNAGYPFAEVFHDPRLERQMKDAATIEELRAVIKEMTQQLGEQERTIEALRQIAKDDGRP